MWNMTLARRISDRYNNKFFFLFPVCLWDTHTCSVSLALSLFFFITGTVTRSCVLCSLRYYGRQCRMVVQINTLMDGGKVECRVFVVVVVDFFLCCCHCSVVISSVMAKTPSRCRNGCWNVVILRMLYIWYIVVFVLSFGLCLSLTRLYVRSLSLSIFTLAHIYPDTDDGSYCHEKHNHISSYFLLSSMCMLRYVFYIYRIS